MRRYSDDMYMAIAAALLGHWTLLRCAGSRESYRTAVTNEPQT